MPSQKSGMVTPIWLTTEVATSRRLPGRSAEMMPAGNAMSIPTSSAMTVSCSVAGSRDWIWGSTGWPVMRLRPQSPRKTPVNQFQYCTKKGSFSPMRSRSAATFCSLACTPSTTRAGSPGTSWMMRKTIKVTPSRTTTVSNRRCRM